MTHAFDVFVSYARADEVFAEQVVGMLKEAGLTVWWDHEQLAPGQGPEEIIEAGLQASRHGVFIVSDHWLNESDWTRWELVGFVQRDAQRRLVRGRVTIPIVRGKTSRRLPPGLSGVKALPWPIGADEDAQFWLLYCGLMSKKLGPPAGWKDRGRQARGLESAVIGDAEQDLEADTVARGRRYAREIFSCDRVAQWGDVTWRASVEQDELIVINGSCSEAHNIFLNRIYEFLPNDPQREIVKVAWFPAPPKTQPQFVAALAEALGCAKRDDAVAAALHDQLVDQNLILLHEPVVHDILGDPQLFHYYVQWLPELLARADARGSGTPRARYVKAVQAISWPYVPRIVSWTTSIATPAALLAVPAIHGIVQRRHAEITVNKLAAESKRLTVFTLDELRRIRRDDVAKWASGVPDIPDRPRFVRDVTAGWMPSSATILHRIVELIGGFREY
jgi:hypothetical protein